MAHWAGTKPEFSQTAIPWQPQTSSISNASSSSCSGKRGLEGYVGGPKSIGDYIRSVYSPNGVRSFDYHFMGKEVYERTFTVAPCAVEEVPPEREQEQALGRHLEGCRVGFDLGASDLKVSAVLDGEAIFSEEIVWEPRKHSDPSYHYGQIMAALRLAISKLPRVDAIGAAPPESTSTIALWSRPSSEAYPKSAMEKSGTCSCACAMSSVCRSRW